jgi:AcrR family transcriptional regulator
VPRTGPGGKPARGYRSAQRTAQAQRTRQRIIAAAAEQFAGAGYPATTMRSIAAAAGVSVASIELAFGTKNS